MIGIIMNNDSTLSGFSPEDLKNLNEINETQKKEGYNLNEVGLRVDYPSTYLPVKSHFEENGEIYVTVNLRDLQSAGNIKISLGYKKAAQATPILSTEGI